MRAVATALPDVLLLTPQVIDDERGSFTELWNRRCFAELGVDVEFVQDNHSLSHRNVVRGLHYQLKRPQGKLIRVAAGSIYDVAVDLRRASPTFGRWVAFTLSAEDGQMAWIPPGFAHGYCATAESSEVFYKVTDYWSPEDERTLLWSDAALGISWPLAGPAILAPKDAAGTPLSRAETYP